MPDEIISSRRLYEGFFDLLLIQIRLNNQLEERPLVEHPCGSAVLPYDPERGVALLVRQTRDAIIFAGGAQLAEVVAGVAEDNDFADTAKREAMEEAGIRLSEVEHVGTVWMNPSTSTERVHLFLAEYRATDRVGDGGGLQDENEQLTVRERPLIEIWKEVTSAEIADAKTLLLLQTLRIRRPDLFEE